MNCHANGDVAIDHVLTAYERALKAFPRADARPKITHCSLINDHLLARIKAMNAVPALFTTYAYYNSDKFHFYGEDMMKHMMAFRTLLDAVCGGGGLGFQPRSVRALDGHAGHGDAQRLERRDLGRQPEDHGGRGDTGQHHQRRLQHHEENIKGSITAGKLADYVVLADDLHTIDPEKIKDIKIVRTVTGGKTVYQG